MGLYSTSWLPLFVLRALLGQPWSTNKNTPDKLIFTLRERFLVEVMLSILQSYATRMAKKSGATFSTNQRPFVTCSQEGSRVWRPLHVFFLNSDWFVGLSAFSVTGLVFTVEELF